ncbi:MAG: PAS domain S-box protein [Sphaerochaetaceae bacterium]|nr:PAS domain S-box protein [Sphaerochaetaceae bacterium]
MMYTWTPEALILSIMVLVEGIFITFLLRRRKEHGAVELALFLLVVSVHNLTYMLETMALPWGLKSLWDTLQYVTIAWYPITLLHFSNRYFNLRLKNVSVFYMVFISVSVTLTIIILTMPFHDLFITDVQFLEGLFRPNIYKPKIFVMVLNFYALFGGLLYVYYSFYMTVSEKGLYRVRGACMMLMILIPLIGMFFYVGMKKYITLYYSPFLYFAGALFPKYLLFTGKLFGSVPVENSILKDSLIDGVLIIDRSGVILDMNRKVQEFFPEITDECVGLDIEEAGLKAPFLQLVHSREESDTLREGTSIEYHGTDGQVATYEVRRSYFENNHHRSHASVLTIRDVSEMKSMQEELRKRHERIIEDNRMKGLLIEVISHDVRSPLVLMKGLRQLMASGVTREDSGVWKRGGEDLDSLIDRADSLIANLLALSESFSEWETYQLQTMSLSGVLPQLQDSIRRLASRKRVNCTYDIEEHLEVTAHPALLKSVLRNVVENAVKYSTPGQTVQFLGRSAASVVQVVVENRGEPIDPEALRAFEEGRWGVTRMGSAGEKGPGIGLYASALFMKKMAGSMEIAALKQGTRVVLSFPFPAVNHTFDRGSHEHD